MAGMKKTGIALLGVGNVGAGVSELLASNNIMPKRAGVKIDIVAACARNVRRARRRLGGAKVPVYPDWRQAIAAPGCDIVVELMGGLDDALDCARAVLDQGKPLVTANKALLAHHGAELLELARARGAGIHYEAAVAGCIPAIRTVRDALAGDQIVAATGILNGTCNYIMTQMAQQGRDFDEALALASELGYAEAEPSLDIDGWDAAHKTAILAWLACGLPLGMEKMTVQGIRGATLADRDCAAEFGYVIKLLAQVKDHGRRGVETQVGPGLIAQDHPLAAVNDNLNGLLLDTRYAGELLLVGAGAGALPTASAVVADIIEAVREGPPPLSFGGKAAAKHCGRINSGSQAYLRVAVIDAKGVLASVSRILASAGMSIEAIFQQESHSGEEVDVAILLHELEWKDLLQAMRKIARLKQVTQPPTAMPIVIPHRAKP